MRETPILQSIRVALSAAGAIMWRNNTGALRDDHDRLVRFGLCEGSSDLIGLRSVTVTPEMVGQRVAVFVACEVKAPGMRPTAAQSRFLTAVRDAGGIAFVATSDEEAVLSLSLSTSPRQTLPARAE